MRTSRSGTWLAQSLDSDRSHRHPLAANTTLRPGSGQATESVRQGLLDRVALLRRIPALPLAGPALGGAAPATDLLTPARPLAPSPTTARPRARGKFLFLGNEKLSVRGVTYGTFRPRADRLARSSRNRDIPFRRSARAVRAVPLGALHTACRFRAEDRLDSSLARCTP